MLFVLATETGGAKIVHQDLCAYLRQICAMETLTATRVLMNYLRIALISFVQATRTSVVRIAQVDLYAFMIFRNATDEMTALKDTTKALKSVVLSYHGNSLQRNDMSILILDFISIFCCVLDLH